MLVFRFLNFSNELTPPQSLNSLVNSDPRQINGVNQKKERRGSRDSAGTQDCNPRL